MRHESQFWDRRIEDVELILADVDEAWPGRWSAMDAMEQTHLLNVELLDAERYLHELERAQQDGQLDGEQSARLDRVLRARADAQPTIDAMTAVMRRSLEMARGLEVKEGDVRGVA